MTDILTVEQALALPQYADVKVRLFGRKTFKRAVVTGTKAVTMGDGTLRALVFFHFSSPDGMQLRRQGHAATLGGRHGDEVVTV